MTPTQLAAIAAVCAAIMDAVKAAGPHGAPGGVIYSALMASGCSLNQYQSFMAGLVRAGKLEQRGQLYFVAP